MPRQPTITLEDVVAIADRMTAGGIKPTPRLILEEHGSGGLGTIYQLFKQWQTRQEYHVDGGLTLPPLMQRAILDYMGQELARARSELEASLAESEQRAADLARENERQAAVIEEQSELLAALQESAALQHGRTTQLEQDCLSAREEAQRERAAAEKARTDVAKAELRLEGVPRLESEVIELRAQCESERVKRVAAEQIAAVATSQKDGLAERCDEDKEQIRNLVLELRTVECRYADVVAQLTSSRLAVELANSRIAAADRELAAHGRRMWTQKRSNAR